MSEKNSNMDKRIQKLFSGFLYACDINNKNLQKILNDNKNTKFGVKYGFSNITSPEEFAKTVPVAEYADFKEYIQHMYKGEDNVLTVYPVRNFILSSGTKGTVKKFPLTVEALERYSSYIVDIPLGQIDADIKKMIHTSVFRTAGIKGETLLSTAYYSYLDSKNSMPDYLGGKKLLFSDVINNVPYVKLRIMLAYEELSAIHSIFLYDVLMLFRYLDENSNMLLDDIQSGEISVELPDEIKEEIHRLPHTDDKRIVKIKSLLKNGMKASTVSEIWGNIKYISGIGGPAFERQTNMLKKYTGDIPIYYFAYASSELMAGAAVTANKAEYMLLPDSAYYEFLHKNSSEPIMLSDITIGETYELVITTFSGLYRYRTGDLIRILGVEGQAPLFEVLGRKNDIINIAGEKIDAGTMQEAVNNVSEKISEIGDFCVAADYTVIPARIHIFAETQADSELIEKAMDKELCRLSADYEDIRRLGMIRMPEVTCLKNGFISYVFTNESSHSKPKLFLTHEQYKQLKSEVSKGETK